MSKLVYAGHYLILKNYNIKNKFSFKRYAYLSKLSKIRVTEESSISCWNIFSPWRRSHCLVLDCRFSYLTFYIFCRLLLFLLFIFQVLMDFPEDAQAFSVSFHDVVHIWLMLWYAGFDLLLCLLSNLCHEFSVIIFLGCFGPFSAA